MTASRRYADSLAGKCAPIHTMAGKVFVKLRPGKATGDWVYAVDMPHALGSRRSLPPLCQISEHGFAGLLGRFECLER